MHPVSARIDGRLPVVVDKKQCAGALHRLNGRTHFTFNRLAVVGLEAQLHGRHTGTGHTRDPGRIWQHRIQTKLVRAGRKSINPRPRAQSKVCGHIRPRFSNELTLAPHHFLPGISHAFGVDFDKTKRQ